MVISDEIKFPRPIKVDPYRTEKKIDPVDGTPPVTRIGAFSREWQRRRQEQQERRPYTGPNDEESVRRLVDTVNTHLKNQDIQIHLLLIRDENGFAIDVYDCTRGDRCEIIGDVVIDLEDLPVLLKNLQQETGILLDTVS